MDKRIFSILVVACAAFCVSATAQADIVVAGNWQIANGATLDWSPAQGVPMTDLGGGLFELPLSGLTGAGAKSRFELKALDDGGTPPAAWGDPEVPAVTTGVADKNTWFVTDSTGGVTIMLDRNTYNDGFFPQTDRMVMSTDSTEFTNFFATGDFQIAAGGGANDAPGDSLFAMTDQGGGLWSVDVTIATPGTYKYTATADGDTNNFDFEFGVDGRYRHDTADTLSTPLSFFTVATNQVVTLSLDLTKGAIAFSTGTFLDGDTNNNGLIDFEADFGPIRDNWLNQTLVREEGNIDNFGDSAGIVDVSDFRQWKDACTAAGCATPLQIALAFNSIGVPEPGTAVLAALAGIGWFARRRRRG